VIFVAVEAAVVVDKEEVEDDKTLQVKIFVEVFISPGKSTPSNKQEKV
jgi:hypothetical protein